MNVLVINGPNMNLLGLRKPEVYGRTSYEQLVQYIKEKSQSLNIDCDFFQSNYEGAIVEAIQNARLSHDAIIINPAAYTHTSIAIADALEAVALPTVEVHISDPDTREQFRHTSYIRPHCIHTVKGEGIEGYIIALSLLKQD